MGRPHTDRWVRRRAVTLAVLAAAGALATLSAGAPAAAVSPGTFRATATFSSPPETGHVFEPLDVHPTGVAAHGYVENEYFAGGTATAFASTAAPADGRWTIAPTTTSAYRTRILVRRPSNPARFSGTVVVEWMNETSGETAPDWQYFDPALMDAGDAWVGVSVQAVGVQGGSLLLGLGTSTVAKGLVQQEPQRYGSLHHPGDQYDFDIFDQIGLGLRHPAGEAVLGPLHARHVVAVGESQSAFALTSYADAIEPWSHAFDGIFIHSRGGGATPLGPAPDAGKMVFGNVRIRTDLHVPVFMLETETDAAAFDFTAALQPDTTKIRTWEVAGTSHADTYVVGAFSSVIGCGASVNSGPQHEVAQAAFVDFTRWVLRGTPPPSPPPFQLQGRHPVTLAVDAHGNAIGGVRTPAVDVPVSTLSATPLTGASVLCSLFGSTVPFSGQTLTALYGTKATYLSRYAADLRRAIAAGYLLPSERTELLEQAGQVSFPSTG